MGRTLYRPPHPKVPGLLVIISFTLIRVLYLADNSSMDKETIALAIQGLEMQRSKIDAAIRDLQELYSGLPDTDTTRVVRSKRAMSPAGRKAISDAQKKRWANQRKTE
mgnify:CR=1 FL=1